MSRAGWHERIAHLLLTRTPLGLIVRWFASIPISVHAKLLSGFLLITLVLIAMGATGLQIIAKMSRQSHLMHQAHDRGYWSLQMEHAFAMQMNFTSLALILKDEATIARILRENNRFNNTMARIEEAAPPEERELIQLIRTAQEEAMTTVADIANLVREGRLDEATKLQVAKEYPLYVQIEGLINQVVKIEQDKMDDLRRSVAVENQRAMILMGGFVAASILLALLLGFVISWSFILPVREAQGFLGRVAMGDFGASIAVPNRDEYGVLADHLNRMSRELHRLHEDQRQAARELTTLNEQLKRASMAKSEFLASMSHELRTPMNAILGFTELMLDGIYGEIPPSLKGPLTDVQVNGKHLLRLINEVLDLSKIEAGRMELSLGEYSARDIVETVTASLRSLAAEKGLEFIARVEEDIPPAVADGKRLTQCLMNLAGNALKFTKEGRVEIGVELKANTLVYRVSDTGIGIPQDQISKLFEEFRQLDATVAHEFGGTGLGLSITKKFVELHGGRLWAESQVGQGSTFFFSVPLRVDKGKPA
ncbi:MAG: histidine kinase [Candidatus Rokubacteria bacterium CSP1-6]|nr:MAG: histidine kinase [Candidatus Rokubacteria bacterium CSP1-6]